MRKVAGEVIAAAAALTSGASSPVLFVSFLRNKALRLCSFEYTLFAFVSDSAGASQSQAPSHV